MILDKGEVISEGEPYFQFGHILKNFPKSVSNHNPFFERPGWFVFCYGLIEG